MIKMAVRSSEAKMASGFLCFKIFLISISLRIGEKSLDTLIIGASGRMEAKPAWRRPVGEFELSFPVIIMIFWAPDLTKVSAAKTPPA